MITIERISKIIIELHDTEDTPSTVLHSLKTLNVIKRKVLHNWVNYVLKVNWVLQANQTFSSKIDQKKLQDYKI